MLWAEAEVSWDDGETTAPVAGSCRLDRGVEREHVGLIGDVGDRAYDPADLVGLGAKLGDRGCQGRGGLAHGFHRLRSTRRRVGAALGQLTRTRRGGGRLLCD